MRMFIVGFSFFIMAVPSLVEASVYISEVAWMGNSVDANAEWVELYNDGEVQNVNGWTVTALDGQPVIILSGSIASNSYALLERSTDATVPNVTAFTVYTGALGNTGEKLELRDQNGVVIDSVDGSDVWSVGGDNITKETLQRSGEPAIGAWVTGVASPQGSARIVSPEEEQDTEQSSSSSTSAPSSSSKRIGGNILYGSTVSKDTTPHLEPALTLLLEEERTVTVGVSTSFLARAFKEKGEEIVVSDVVWNFGDGTVKKGREVTHTYRYTGDYLVTVTGRRSGFLREISDTQQLVVHVVESPVEITHADPSYIEVKNKSKDIIDISNFVFISGDQHFKIPMNTALLPNTSVRFPSKTTKVSRPTVSLFRSDGAPASVYGASVAPTPRQTLAYVPTVQKVASLPVEGEQKQISFFDDLDLPSDLPVFTEMANAYEGATEESGQEKNDSVWWWILGLVTAICTAVLAVILVRKERLEVIEGYVIEGD